MRSRRIRCTLPALGAVALIVFAVTPAGAQDRYNVHFRSAQLTGQAGLPLTVPIGLDNQPGAVTALSLGVKHDAAFLSIERVDLGSALQAVISSPPDDRFYSLNLTPSGGTGFTFAAIFGADSPTAASIPAGLDHAILSVRYRIGAAATGSTQIQITGDLGSPKVGVIIDVKGVAKAPTATPPPVTSATVTITEGPAPFLRGDASQSGRLDISDAIIILNYLFQGGTLPGGAATRDGCPVAMNVDGSTDSGTRGVEEESDIDATDPIVLLSYLFNTYPDAPPPAAPFPSCGAAPNEVAPELSCTTFNCK